MTTLSTIMMRISMTSMMTLLMMKIREAMMPMVKIRTIKDESLTGYREFPADVSGFSRFSCFFRDFFTAIPSMPP